MTAVSTRSRASTSASKCGRAKCFPPAAISSSTKPSAWRYTDARQAIFAATVQLAMTKYHQQASARAGESRMADLYPESCAAARSRGGFRRFVEPIRLHVDPDGRDELTLIGEKTEIRRPIDSTRDRAVRWGERLMRWTEPPALATDSAEARMCHRKGRGCSPAGPSQPRRCPRRRVL